MRAWPTSTGLLRAVFSYIGCRYDTRPGAAAVPATRAPDEHEAFHRSAGEPLAPEVLLSLAIEHGEDEGDAGPRATRRRTKVIGRLTGGDRLLAGRLLHLDLAALEGALVRCAPTPRTVRHP